MPNIDTAQVGGRGRPDLLLAEPELREIVAHTLAGIPCGARVLAIVPDKTRDDNTSLLFPIAAEVLATARIAQFDALIAQGTHPAMTDKEKREKLAAGRAVPGLARVLDHQWDQDGALVTLGELDAHRVGRLTGDLMQSAVPIRVNRLLAPGTYDVVLVFGGTVPHEVAGFSGGAKYFFPGVAGPELTHMTHWLGALATIEHVIGRVETPTRRLIEAAADFVPARVIAFTSVTTRDGAKMRTHALFTGDVKESLRCAADVSRRVHIRYTGRRYRRILALLDEHYDELWVGGKASYKLGSIMEEGGELVIYAPQLNRVSATHGRLIEKYGYAPLEEVREMIEWSDELKANLCVAAHLAHVSYAARKNAQGVVVPRYRITLASSVPEEVCHRLKLGYVDYRSVRREEFERDRDSLVVENAGRDLYLLHPDGGHR